MTASDAHRQLGSTIIRLGAPPRPLAQPGSHDQLLAEVQRLNHIRPGATRQATLDAATIRHSRRLNRSFAACMAIILAALLGAAHLESAWTASIAADLAD